MAAQNLASLVLRVIYYLLSYLLYEWCQGYKGPVTLHAGKQSLVLFHSALCCHSLKEGISQTGLNLHAAAALSLNEKGFLLLEDI
ncbi:hypothetical protein GOODEAATRI_014806 [Goodea atripinnis]|uniref:Uncharacterized protein n=1 Tax=Goodea atripinnis TaxID=208336 RepID=A0ABV0N1J2_9TELE